MRIFICPCLEAEPQCLIAQAVPIFQHQQFFTGQIGHGNTLTVCPRMILINRQFHWFIKQWYFDKCFRFLDHRENGAVQLAAIQMCQ